MDEINEHRQDIEKRKAGNTTTKVKTGNEAQTGRDEQHHPRRAHTREVAITVEGG